jgi:hypothetical protein
MIQQLLISTSNGAKTIAFKINDITAMISPAHDWVEGKFDQFWDYLNTFDVPFPFNLSGFLTMSALWLALVSLRLVTGVIGIALTLVAYFAFGCSLFFYSCAHPLNLFNHPFETFQTWREQLGEYNTVFVDAYIAGVAAFQQGLHNEASAYSKMGARAAFKLGVIFSFLKRMVSEYLEFSFRNPFWGILFFIPSLIIGGVVFVVTLFPISFYLPLFLHSFWSILGNILAHPIQWLFHPVESARVWKEEFMGYYEQARVEAAVEAEAAAAAHAAPQALSSEQSNLIAAGNRNNAINQLPKVQAIVFEMPNESWMIGVEKDSVELQNFTQKRPVVYCFDNQLRQPQINTGTIATDTNPLQNQSSATGNINASTPLLAEAMGSGSINDRGPQSSAVYTSERSAQL